MRLTRTALPKKGQGSTFCTNLNCSMPSHANKQKLNVKNGDVFIAASTDCAFAKAYVNASEIESSLLNHWFSQKQTEEE